MKAKPCPPDACTRLWWVGEVEKAKRGFAPVSLAPQTRRDSNPERSRLVQP